MTSPQVGKPSTILLIHGLWMTPLSWEHWVERYSAAGYQVLTPGWPGIGDGVEGVAAIRKDPSPIAGLGVTQIADHYDTVIRGLDAPPIIMGHSFGGLITQILVDRGLGAAGVGIDPGPVKGVLGLPVSALRVASSALRNPANFRRTVTLSPKQFHYAFGNTLSFAESEAVRERYAIPGPGRPLFQAGLATVTPRAATAVNLRNNDRAPLLLIGGGEDHTVPASMTRENLRRYKHSTAVTELREFAGRSHYICGQPGWEEVADYALAWADEHAAT